MYSVYDTKKVLISHLVLNRKYKAVIYNIIKYFTFDNLISEKERCCGNRSYALSHKQVTQDKHVMCGVFKPFLIVIMHSLNPLDLGLWVEHEDTQ